MIKHVLIGTLCAVLSTGVMAFGNGGNGNYGNIGQGTNGPGGQGGQGGAGGQGGQAQGGSSNPTQIGGSQNQSTRVQTSSDSRSSSQSASQSASQSGAQSGAQAQGGSVNFVIPEGGLVRDNRSTTNNLSIPEGAVEAKGGTGGMANGSVEVSMSADNDYEAVAAQASTVYTQACQTGASGQVEGGGFNVVSIDAFCQRVDAARVWLEVHAYADRHGDEALAEKAGQMFMHNINEAQELVDYDEYPAKVDNFFSRLIKPVAVVTALVFLI